MGLRSHTLGAQELRKKEELCFIEKKGFLLGSAGTLLNLVHRRPLVFSTEHKRSRASPFPRSRTPKKAESSGLGREVPGYDAGNSPTHPVCTAHSLRQAFFSLQLLFIQTFYDSSYIFSSQNVCGGVGGEVEMVLHTMNGVPPRLPVVLMFERHLLNFSSTGRKVVTVVRDR